MVNFGKKFEVHKIEKWKSYYLSYNLLKKAIYDSHEFMKAKKDKSKHEINKIEENALLDPLLNGENTLIHTDQQVMKHFFL